MRDRRKQPAHAALLAQIMLATSASFEDLGRKSPVSASTLSRWMNGQVAPDPNSVRSLIYWLHFVAPELDRLGAEFARATVGASFDLRTADAVPEIVRARYGDATVRRMYERGESEKRIAAYVAGLPAAGEDGAVPEDLVPIDGYEEEVASTPGVPAELVQRMIRSHRERKAATGEPDSPHAAQG